MREFLIAAKRAETDDNTPAPVTIPIREVPKDGQEKGDLREIVCEFPGAGAVAALMATNASYSSSQERMAGVMNFFVATLSEEDHSWIVGRLFDRNDPFDGEHIAEFVMALMEEWSGRPTQPSTGSTGSPSAGGRKSRARTPALTSSD